jgi:AcrR family transcriptional regulator
VDTGTSIDERQRLLGLTAGYLLERGVLDLRLRTLGEAIGASHRVLLYYFESREQLVGEALDEVARRTAAPDGLRFAPHGTGAVHVEIVRAWRRASAPEQLPLVRLLLQVLALSLNEPDRYARFLHAVDDAWSRGHEEFLVARGMTRAEARRLAREIVALQRGLQLQLAAGGSRATLDRSFADAAAGWAARVDGATSGR